MSGQYTIYGLTDPTDGKIRYVGKAANLAKRLRQHMRRVPVYDWIRELEKKNLAPRAVTLEVVPLDGNPFVAESKLIGEHDDGTLLNRYCTKRSQPRTERLRHGPSELTRYLTQGRAISDWMTRNGLSKESVAVAANVSRQTVDNWERGRSTPRTEHVQKMTPLAPGLLMALGLRGGK